MGPQFFILINARKQSVLVKACVLRFATKPEKLLRTKAGKVEAVQAKSAPLLVTVGMAAGQGRTGFYNRRSHLGEMGDLQASVIS